MHIEVRDREYLLGARLVGPPNAERLLVYATCPDLADRGTPPTIDHLHVELEM